MQIEEEYIRLIFGLKLKQLRTDKNLSLYGLSKLSGLSKSYLNEIENGKKYPKQDKILILSRSLGVSYDELVSLKLDKNLAPVGEILESGILKEIPLELFGIAENDLISIISNAPTKVNAFISTIIEIAQHYNVGIEGFYLAALRSYQEAENNFFPELEEAAVRFAEAYQVDLSKPIKSEELAAILQEEYGYTIMEQGIANDPMLDNLRSIFVPSSKRLLLSTEIDETQKLFIFGKEIAYNFLKLSVRPYTFSWITYNSFDEVLHNFRASYFSGALVVPRDQLSQKLENLLHQDTWSDTNFLELLNGFNASPETVYQRLTNILPNDFRFRNLFFLRFTHKKGDARYYLNKELHITHQQEPQANEYNEHYCRRWISIKTLHQIENQPKDHHFDSQISVYENGSRYLVLSSATPDPFRSDHYRSISLGILLTDRVLKQFKILNDTAKPEIKVGITCESCSISDCELRAAPPRRLQKVKRHQETEERVAALMKAHAGKPEEKA
ncbi:helix-turn-helix domain-containing protein [Robertkochia aurantiaca]|uniref:helix-turn-helix domain-containing protein n=1 Tax=Robertkochia aurantiaca TaxID=2873700 RepID=UPI001CCC0EBD|nr:XRE family transcriptional regulator [Robertkochia sp. 3YJGBD-33]